MEGWPTLAPIWERRLPHPWLRVVCGVRVGLHSGGMAPKPKRYQNQGCLHFITFSCYQRRKLLDSVAAREIFECQLERVRQWYGCYMTGFAVMPEHVHLLISEPERVSSDGTEARGNGYAAGV